MLTVLLRGGRVMIRDHVSDEVMLMLQVPK